ncbi:MFS transporter [Congregibacter brevis]|uniref:MFS transporter n=1 Tax=Congregibacter brevis TaxID=3081201 RepID=A0ABZ0IEZ3_9GAMM|nr:MFS transporter [Congregibacter sp. IMCC45268]
MSETLTRRQLLVLITALMATGIGQSLVFAILAPLGREVDLAEVQITSIIALSALVFAIASPYWGRLSDRVGRKPVILIGLIGYTVGTLLFTSVFMAGLAGVLSGLSLYGIALITRCSQSVVMSASSPSTTAYAADSTSTSERTAAMAKLGTANSLGMILGPAVSGALATLGLLAPLYFAGALSAAAALLVWRALPSIPAPQRVSHTRPKRMRFLDPRIRRFALTAIGLFTGFSAIQQTLGFQLQDQLELTGVETAQYTGAALMVSAVFTFIVQVTAMQRLKLPPHVFVRTGLASMALGSLLIASFPNFTILAMGMALLGTGLGLSMPAITAGASIAVSPEEQGGAAGVISACPAVGFVSGPIIGGLLYPLAPFGPALFSALMFSATIAFLVGTSKR